MEIILAFLPMVYILRYLFILRDNYQMLVTSNLLKKIIDIINFATHFLDSTIDTLSLDFFL